MEEYYSIITKLGAAKLAAAAIGEAEPVNITEFVIGDGGGKVVTPDANQTELIGQKWSGPIKRFTTEGNQFIVETSVPETVGDFYIREVGFKDKEGTLIAVGNIPEVLKIASTNFMNRINIGINVKITNSESIVFTIEKYTIDYAICNSAENAVAKEAVCDEEFALYEGQHIYIKFENTNTAIGATLNVNQTGAYPINNKNAAIKSGILEAGETYLFVFDGENYNLIGDINHTHDVATRSSAGLLSAADKEKLDSIDEGANKTVVDSSLSDSSENPVENRAVKAGLDKKADVGHAHNLNGSDITGTLPISKGGTGADTAEAARTNLGLGSASLLSDTNLLVYRGEIPAGANWDDYNTTGIWICTRSDKSTDTNSPPSISWGYLIVLTYTTPIQLFITGGKYAGDVIYSRGIGQNWRYVGDYKFALINHTHTEYLPISSYKGRTHIVIASYNTKNPNKNYADFVCTAENASAVIRQALNAVEPGGKIELLDGDYFLQYEDFGEGIVINKKVSIEGTSGARGANLQQPIDQYGGEANPVFTINSVPVIIKNLNIYGVKKECSSPVSLIKQKTTMAWYENLSFSMNSPEAIGYSCIEGETGKDCSYTRIRNCRLYRSFNPGTLSTYFIAFDFRNCKNFSGFISGNLSTGYGNIDVGLPSKYDRQKTAIYGHSTIDIYMKNNKEKETIDYKGDIITTDYSE